VWPASRLPIASRAFNLSPGGDAACCDMPAMSSFTSARTTGVPSREKPSASPISETVAAAGGARNHAVPVSEARIKFDRGAAVPSNQDVVHSASRFAGM